MRRPTRVTLVGELLAVLLVCMNCSAHRPPSCRPQLARTGFLQELLFPQGTARTPDFDDYTDGSYHVEKVDLLEGVRAIREHEHIAGVIVYGPVGPLWAYNVLLFVAEGDEIRLNTVAFPHARITGKTTRVLSRAQYEEALTKLSASQAVIMGVPSFETLRGRRTADLPLEWHYSLLMADWSTGAERLWHSAGDDRTLSGDEIASLTSGLNELLKDSTTTYTTSLPEGYDTNICPDEP